MLSVWYRMTIGNSVSVRLIIFVKDLHEPPKSNAVCTFALEVKRYNLTKMMKILVEQDF